MTRTLLIASLLVSATASAATVSGVPTSVTIYNSTAYGQACDIVMGSTTYRVDDAAGNFGATCIGASVARAQGTSIVLDYNSSSSPPYAVYGIYSAKTSSTVDYIYTNDYTGTSSADQCKAYLNGTSGSAWYYVDDGGPEEDLTCGMLFLLQASGRSWSVTYSGSEIQYLTIK